MSFVYLASPYSSKSPLHEEINYQKALLAFSILHDMHCPAFSPIIHCHEAAKIYNKGRSAVFWKEYNKNFIQSSYAVFILTIKGWMESRGVAMEVGWASIYDKPLKLASFVLDNALRIDPVSYEDVKKQLVYIPDWADLHG
jgi:Domain of unknown function (DUF1937)